MAHAKLSPSSAYCWLYCALSIKMIELFNHLDPNRYSPANADGTIKHHVFEKCLKHDYDPYSYVGYQFRLGDLREDDEDMPQEWCDYTYDFSEADADEISNALDRIDLIGGDRHVELRVNLDRWLPGQFGTLDLGIIIEHGDDSITIIIWDNKFGRIPVSPVENPQMRIYGLGFLDSVVYPKYGRGVKIRKFKFIIFQPTVKGGGGDWDCSLRDLLEFGKFVKKRGKRALADDPVATPGPSQCQWCIGAKLGKCGAYEVYHKDYVKKMLEPGGDEFDDLVEEDQIPFLTGKGLSPEEKKWILDNFASFKRFVERIEEQAFNEAYTHGPNLGRKLVYGNRPNRKFRNMSEAEAVIVSKVGEDKAFKRKLISVAEFEKHIGKKAIVEYKDLIDQGPPKLVLVDERDTRPAVASVRELLCDGDD